MECLITCTMVPGGRRGAGGGVVTLVGTGGLETLTPGAERLGLYGIARDLSKTTGDVMALFFAPFRFSR
jgi:hypothetical protein